MSFRKVKNCIICQTPFIAKSNRSMYCSPKCARDVAARQNVEHTKSRAIRSKKILSDAVMLYDRKCAICGWQIPPEIANPLNQFTFGCARHHILSVSDGGSDAIDNLILLCPNHHKLADLGIIPVEELKKYQRLEYSEEQTSLMEEAIKESFSVTSRFNVYDRSKFLSAFEDIKF